MKIPEDIKEELAIFGPCWLHGSRKMFDRHINGWIWWDQPFWGSKIRLPEDTDWDFACQYVHPWQATDQAANSNGWIECVDQSYCDNSTKHVYEKVIGGKKVQVSMRDNLETYKSAFMSVSTDFYFQYLWKRSDEAWPLEVRCEFWNTLYRAVGVAKDENLFL